MNKLPILVTPSRIALAVLLTLLIPGLDVFAVNTALLNRPRSGSRMDEVHRIDLKNAEGKKIAADDLCPEPFSSRQTCGECHDYEKIRHGWHFSAVTSATQNGHASEPWLLSDRATWTQLPVSLRPWKGTWEPKRLGMTPWQFAMAFGSHLPGGGFAEVDTSATAAMDLESRWDLSGNIEINCLACHGGSSRQDMSEWAEQIKNLNFGYAATAASGLGFVEGSVKSLPVVFDIYRGATSDDKEVQPPRVKYAAANFDNQNKAFVDIKAKPDNNRCYYCHSTAHTGEGAAMSDQDVHLAAGLNCVDCHRNGLDHQIIRGAEGDPALKNNPYAMTLTCKGCHNGEGDHPGGRLRAPHAEHKGMPTLHLEKMSCTACHSGPAPAKMAPTVKTARAHKLGTRVIGDNALPAIVSPVLIKTGEKIQPCNVVWPSFWGVMKGEDVTPLLPEKVSAVAGEILMGRDSGTTGTETQLTEGKAVAALKALAKANPGAGEVVYVTGGKLHKVGAEGKLAASDHETAQPYSWPIGHDVRPAAQALGAKGCTECHAPDAPFLAGKVEVANTLSGASPVAKTMGEWAGQDTKVAQLFAQSFAFRPWFKIFGFAASGLVLGVMLSYGMTGVGVLCRKMGRRN